MRTKNLFIAAMLSTSVMANAQLNSAGSAYFNSAGYLNLVPHPYTAAYKAGAGWSTQTVDFSRPFKITFMATMTPKVRNGGDGFTLVFGTNINTSIGGTVGGQFGGDLGYYNTLSGEFNNSLAVEFDVFDNSSGGAYNDMAGDHVAINMNGDPTAAGTLAGPKPATIQDGTPHYYEVEWDCSGRLKVFEDWDHNNPVIELVTTQAAISSLFGGTVVNWGFTGARQVSGSRILIEDIVLRTNTYCGGPCFKKRMDVQIDFWDCEEFGQNIRTMGITPLTNHSFTLDLGNGTPPAFVTPPHISALHQYAAPGSYVLTMTTSEYDDRALDTCRDTLKAFFYVGDCFAVENAEEWEGGKPSGITEVKNEQVLHIAPNPAVNEAIVTLGTSNITEIKLIDVTGKLVFDEKYVPVNKVHLSLGKLLGGAYTVITSDTDGRQYRSLLVVTGK